VNSSYIQLYGRRALTYLYHLLKLQTYNGFIYFSINMVLGLMGITKNNIKRERKYFKDFLIAIVKHSLIAPDIDLNAVNSNDYIKANLNIYELNDVGKKQKYFELLNSEYNKIMNEYSGVLDKYNLLNLFCNIKSRIYRNKNDVGITERKSEVAYPSYDTISRDIFIENQQTLKQYIDCLVELDFIRYDCAGDMTFKTPEQQTIRRKANFTYALFRPGWEIELENAISMYRSQKRELGWSFSPKIKEIEANEKRRITQTINMLEKLKGQGNITQSQNKELSKLKRQKEKWQYDTDVDVRKLEEEKLLSDNPGKSLVEIYEDMGFEAKADRAYEDREIIDLVNESSHDEFLSILSDDIPESLNLTEKLINKEDDSYEYDYYDDSDGYHDDKPDNNSSDLDSNKESNLPESIKITKKLQEENYWDYDPWDDEEDKDSGDIAGISKDEIKGLSQFSKNKDLPESNKWLNNHDDYDVETLELFLDGFLTADSLDCFDDISNHRMTIKEFFDDVYEYADYAEYLEFKAKKVGKTQLSNIDISTIGVEDDWGTPEPKIKKCICCGENFPDTEDNTFCTECAMYIKQNNHSLQIQEEENDFDW